MADVKEMKDVVVAGAKTFKAVSEAIKNDGKIGISDLPLLLALMPAYLAAFQGLDQVIPEAKDLTSEEIAELVAAVAAELGGMEPSMKNKVEKVLLALKADYEAVQAFM